MRTLIRNARLVSPGWETFGSLMMEAGRITASPDEGADEIVDVEGRIVMPGFIDIHAHGADGDDVCDGTVEAIHRIGQRKLQEGVTTWLPTTLTQPAERLREVVETVGQAKRETRGPRMPGIHLEGPFINAAKAGAQNPQFVRPPDVEELKALHATSPLKILSVAPEMPGALEVIAEATKLGIVCSAAHTAATAEDLGAAKQAGLRHLTHFGNAMSPLHHRAIGAVGAGLLDDELMLELICDGQHLSDDMLRLIFKCVPIERLMLITDSVAASWRQDGPMTLGGLDATISGGVVRLQEGGALAGSTLRFNEGLGRLASLTGLPLHELVKATSWNQARSLGFPDAGKLEAGFAADVVVLNTDFSVWGTWVAGLRGC